jgi:hypothetical protein
LWIPHSTSLAGTTPAIGAEFLAYDLGLRGGAGFSFGTLEVGPRAGVEVTHVRASAFGATTSLRGSETFLTLTLGGLAAWELAPWLALRLEVDGTLPLSRPEFVIVGAGTVHRPPALSARAGLGIAARFF